MPKLIILSALLLAACGASGLPIKPAAKTGMTISGSVEAGVARNGN